MEKSEEYGLSNGDDIDDPESWSSSSIDLVPKDFSDANLAATKFAALELGTRVHCVCCSTDGRYLAATSSRSRSMWSIQIFEEYEEGKYEEKTIFRVVISPDKKTFALMNTHSIVDFWDIRFPRYVSSIAFSPDGENIALGIQGKIMLLDIKNQKLLPSKQALYKCVTIAISPDGRTIASGIPWALLTLYVFGTSTEKRLWLS